MPLPPVPPELAPDAVRQASDAGVLYFVVIFGLLAVLGYRYLAGRENG